MKSSPPPSESKKTGLAPKTSRHGLTVDAATSARMAGVRQSNTSAEQIVRHLVHALGHSYRTKNRDLPGSPDIANRSRGWAVFVHGCFWHRHENCSRTTTPKRNREFWETKFEQNCQRDARALAALRRMGFRTVVIWECEAETRQDQVERRLARRLGTPPRQSTRKRDA